MQFLDDDAIVSMHIFICDYIKYLTQSMITIFVSFNNYLNGHLVYKD